MEEVKETDEEIRQAKMQMWDYAFGFTPMAVIKCAIHLQIADLLEAHGGSITHSELSAAIGGSPEVLRRIMRYLINRRFFKQTTSALTPEISYAHTPLSRLLIKNGSDSMAAIVMLQSSPAMLNPWHRLNSRVLESGGDTPFEAENGKNIWDYNRENPEQCKLFDDGMACMARQSMAAIIDQYPEAFEGVGSVVDVGGGDGAALRTLIKARPQIRGINFDQPHVVAAAAATNCDGVELVGGDMFDAVPKADAAFLMRVLHDWSDEECVAILKKCREATRKVIIAEAVIREGAEDIQIGLDMVMLVHTERGKERSVEEWECVVTQAGFTRFAVKHIQAIVSVIEAYP